LGVEGAEGSRCDGIAVGLFVFFADFEVDFAFDLDLDDEGVLAFA